MHPVNGGWVDHELPRNCDADTAVALKCLSAQSPVLRLTTPASCVVREIMQATTYTKELAEATETRALSRRTASRFVAQLGALQPVLIPPLPAAHLGKRPGLQMTVLDHRYWFAKLYEFVTLEEMSYSQKTTYPGFSLHFIKVFYGMYYAAMGNYEKSAFAQVNPLWVTHFRGPPGNVAPDSMQAVEFSVRTGATAHIQGDMAVALVTAYKSWEVSPKPRFPELRGEFIDKSEGAFRAAQARFYIEVNDKTFSPLRPEVGQLAAAYYQKVFNIQPSLAVMFQWRRNAWQNAAASV